MTVQSAEESVFLSPNFVCELVIHSNTSNEIHVRERYDDDSIQALNERKPLAETTLANDVALASNSWKKLVFIDFTFA